MHQELGILDTITGPDRRLPGGSLRRGRIGQALHGSAFVADEVGMLVAGALHVADPISPNLIVSPHPVQEPLARQRIHRPVQRHAIDLIGTALHDLRGAERLALLAQYLQDVKAHRRAAKAGMAK
jgi:hypothetical protein